MLEETKPKEKLFSADFIKIIAVAGLGRICNHMQSVTMPLYMQSIGFSATVAGLMMTVYMLASLCSRPFIGLALDRYRRWPIVVGGTALFALASATLGYLSILWLLIFIRFLHGIGFASHATGINTMGTDVIPESRLSEGIGYLGLTNSLSTAVAPAMALALIAAIDYSRTFLVIFALAAAAVVISITIRYEKKLPPRPKEAARRKLTWADLFEKSSLLPSVVILFLSAANTSLNTFLPTYGEARGIAQVGLFFTMNAAAMAVARLTCGWLSKRFGDKRIMRAGMILCFCGYLVIFFSRSAPGLWAAGIVYGFGYGIVYPVLNAMAVVRANPARRGAANATFLMFLDTGIALGSLIWGLAIDFLGVRWLYLLCALCVAVCFAMNCMPRFSGMYDKNESQ